MSTISGYHAHVYFDADSRDKAQQLCEAAGRALPVTVGRTHDKAVGPHPRGSCQLAFAAEHFGQVMPWLILHRGRLTVFAHAETGDALKDHTDHVIWLGPSEASPPSPRSIPSPRSVQAPVPANAFSALATQTLQPLST